MAVERAVRAGVISGGDARVFQTMLLTFSDGTGKDVTVRRSTIGEWLCRSTRTVRRHVAALEAAGFIEVEHRVKRFRDGTVRQLANCYRFRVPPEFMTGPTGAEDRDPVDTTVKRSAARVVPDTAPPSEPEVDERLQAWQALDETTRAERRRQVIDQARTLTADGMDRDAVLAQLAEAGFFGPELVAAMRQLPQDRAGP